MTTIDDRVAAGSAWLDEHRPGWWQRINLDTLDLGDPCKCVLGQEGGYVVGLKDLDSDEPDVVAAEWGFYSIGDCMGTALSSAIDTEYRALTAAWRALIAARRNATADETASGDEIAAIKRREDT